MKEGHAMEGRPDTDRIEAVENSKNTRAMRLYERILSDLDTTSFTLEDIREAFGDFTKKGGHRTWGQASLDYLIEKNLIIYDERTKTYSVNHEVNPDQVEDTLELLEHEAEG